MKRIAICLGIFVFLFCQVAAVNAADVVINGVPHVYQLGVSCKPNNYLCQYASASMLAGFAWGTDYATYDVMQRMALAAKGNRCPTTLSSMDDALVGLRAVNSQSDSEVEEVSYDQMKNYLKQGIPVGVSVKYVELGNYRCITSWAGGHSIVVIGYSETNQTWTYRDPLCSSGTKTVPSSIFRKAIAASSGSDDKFNMLVVLPMSVKLTVYDFAKMPAPIYADPLSSIWHPNFSAAYGIRNDGTQAVTIKKLALAIHDSGNNFKFDMANSSTGQPRYYENLTLYHGDTHIFAQSVAYFQTAGNYKVVAKAQMTDGTWKELASQDFTVLPAQSVKPTVSVLSINNGAGSTNSRTVTLNHTAAGSPLHYMASESSGFPGASWQTYSSAPSFTLSAGNTTKTVWFKVKNNAGESSAVSDTIMLSEADTTLPTGKISGISSSYKAGATVSYTVSGSDNKNLSVLHFTVTDRYNTKKHDKVWSVSGTSATKSASFSTSGWTAGTYYYALWVKDAAGNAKDYTGSFTIYR